MLFRTVLHILLADPYASMDLDAESLRFRYINEQGYDRSCGWSATATLLAKYWGIPVTEAELMQRFVSPGADPATGGANLAEMCGALAEHGIAYKAFTMTWEQLAEAMGTHSPALVHYDYPELHFALVLGFVDDGAVLCGDPARGTEILSRAVFEQRWSGVVVLTASNRFQRNLGRLTSALSEASIKHKQMEDAAWHAGW